LNVLEFLKNGHTQATVSFIFAFSNSKLKYLLASGIQIQTF